MTTTSTGVPIGHGPLADHAAKPAEFARLIHHLEHAHLVTHDDQWHDNMPSGPTPLDEHPSAWPTCRGSCAENARPCPRPRACWLTQCHDGAIRRFIWAIGITGAAIAVGLLLARLI